jgi:transcriptional regulator with XRE-family HTH domain
MAEVEHVLSVDDSKAVALIVREEIARRRITRLALADQARISLSTLEKALSGRRPFTLATTIRLEDALGVTLRSGSAAHGSNGSSSSAARAYGPATAPDDLGSYSRAGVNWLEGAYVTVRPSFGEPDALYLYQTMIAWDEPTSSLLFHEADRIDADFTQTGSVSVPHQSGHIYLVTNRHGQFRLIIVARPAITGEMHGILTTLQAGRGSQLTPIATPIVLIPTANVGTVEFGRLPPLHRDFARFRKLLRRTVDDQYARLLGLG